MLRRTSLRSSKPLSRGTPLKKRGPTAIAWEKFRNETFQKEADAEGLIKCQDWMIGLPKCGIARSSMDLHHVHGRAGKLLFDRSKMVWLTRQCHEAAHNGQPAQPEER